MHHSAGVLSGDKSLAALNDRFDATVPPITLMHNAGTWSGNYTFTDRCSNDGTASCNGSFTLGLTQSAARAAGVVTMQNVPLYDQNCRTITLLNMALSASGVVSGSTFTAGVYDPSGSFEFPITATIAGEAMNGTAAGASQTSTTGSFTLARSSAQRRDRTSPAVMKGRTPAGNAVWSASRLPATRSAARSPIRSETSGHSPRRSR